MQFEIRHNRPAEPVHMVWGPIAVLFIITAGFLNNVVSDLPACVFHKVTGLPCLTCGGTRSLIALSEFDLVSSFVSNPLVPLFVLGLICFSMLFLVGAVTNRSIKVKFTDRLKRTIRFSAVGIIALNWLFLIVTGR